MKIGRNAPCPCGSGKKYKACCLKLDRGNPTPPGGMPIREAASRATSWQADLMPIPARFEDEPGARPAAVMVTAAGLVIFTEILARPSAEVDDIAAELARAIERAAENVGKPPAALEVREPEVAEALSERLAAAGSPVPVRAAVLGELEEAMAALNRSMGGSPGAYVATSPDLWEGWGQPAEWIAQLFRSSASYYRAELWKVFDDFPPIVADMPAGHKWYLSVLGSAGEEFGLALHSDADDIDQMLDGALSSPGGRILAVTFDNPQQLPRTMRKEVARAGWEIASAKAYPFMIAIGTPAGGVRRSDAADLIAVFGAMTAWAEAIERGGESLADERWRDPQTGIELECEGHPSGETTVYPSIDLEPGGAEGPAARPQACLDRCQRGDPGPLELESEWLDRFVAEMESEELSERTAADHARNVELFLDYLANWAGVPLAAVHEWDLRSFLFDWYPRKVMTSKTDAAKVPTSLRRFFRFLHRHGSISCPWADSILKTKKAFMSRWDSSPGGFWWDDGVADWRGGHFDDLERRVLVPSIRVPGVLSWGASMGVAEARLNDELQRHWLLWRDEVIRTGIRQSDEVRAVLQQRETRWLTAPHPAYDDRAPVEAIMQEREETARRLRERD